MQQPDLGLVGNRSRRARVLSCRQLIRRLELLGEPPQEIHEGWRVLVRLPNGELLRFTRPTPCRRGDLLDLPN